MGRISARPRADSCNAGAAFETVWYRIADCSPRGDNVKKVIDGPILKKHSRYLSGQECDENQTPEPESNTSDKNNSPDNSLFDIELKTANEEEISTAIQIIGEMAQGGHEQISLTLLHGNLKRRSIGHARGCYGLC